MPNIIHLIRRIGRSIRMHALRKKINVEEFSLLGNNCVAGMLTHDLKKQFKSPTVNLYIPGKDFVCFLEDLMGNLKKEIVDVTNGKAYPIGLLNGNIHLHFMHYPSFEEAVAKWNERKQRIDFENLYIIFIEDGCDYETLQRFDQLPFEHKMAIVHKDYPEIKSAHVIPGYEKENEVGLIHEWDGYWGKRLYDKMDWVSFFNKKG